MKKMLFLIAILVSPAVNAQQNSIHCQLRDFLTLETKVDHTSYPIDVVIINDILTGTSDLSVDFGVYSFDSNLIADGDIYFLVKHRDDYFVFSAKDPMLVTNKLLELQGKFPDELNLELIVQYIKKIGTLRANNMVNYIVISTKKGDLEYIRPIRRYYED